MKIAATRRILITLVLLLAFSATFASAATLYSNGPINGTLDAWTINFGSSVTDSFTLSQTSTITGADFGSWVYEGDTPESVSWLITTAPFGGTTEASGTASITYNYLSTNSKGYDVGKDTFSIPSTTLPAGTYWFQLDDAVTAGSAAMGWDINNGPSVAYENSIGNVANELFPGSNSDSFDILGTPVPVPPSVLLLSSGLLGLVGWRRFRKG